MTASYSHASVLAMVRSKLFARRRQRTGKPKNETVRYDYPIFGVSDLVGAHILWRRTCDDEGST